MIMKKENDFSYAENDFVELAAMSVLGDRKTQEDCFGFSIDHQQVLLCICDGMGGYHGGSIASRTAVETILQSFEQSFRRESPAAFLNALTICANNDVATLHKKFEDAKNAGSTLVSIYIENNLLYWNAVGDSRLYIWRNGDFIQTTKDQNYHTVLKEKLNAGEISKDEFVREQFRGDTLVNYLGIGDLRLIDHNKEPLRLKTSDQLVVCSDGLYRVLTDEEIANILGLNKSPKSTLQMLEFASRKKAKEVCVRRDNMTVALIKIK